MRDNDGRKLDHTTLEQLRIRAVQQIQAGAHPQAIAEALGLARSTVFGWMATYRQGGLDALGPGRSLAGHPSSPAPSGSGCTPDRGQRPPPVGVQVRPVDPRDGG